MSKTNVFFPCTGNFFRRQIFEGWAKHLHVDKINVYSACITHSQSGSESTSGKCEIRRGILRRNK